MGFVATRPVAIRLDFDPRQCALFGRSENIDRRYSTIERFNRCEKWEVAGDYGAVQLCMTVNE